MNKEIGTPEFADKIVSKFGVPRLKAGWKSLEVSDLPLMLGCLGIFGVPLFFVHRMTPIPSFAREQCLPSL